MKVEFLCPYCRSYLKPNTKIILSARKKDGTRGIILFNPKLGAYDILKHRTFHLNKGEHVDIHCPLCNASLTDQTVSDSLVRILMVDEDGTECAIYFSEIYGEQCTFKVSGESVEAFGEDADNYQNFWGAKPRY
ncbi:MAG: hypothetical protein PHD25_09110 [Bacteroidales bacterium]|nr:hypothetical protein [Bacteroidales bacterium]